MILEGEDFYYLVYTRSSAEKYFTVYHSASGEKVFNAYKPLSYNFKKIKFKRYCPICKEDAKEGREIINHSIL